MKGILEVGIDINPCQIPSEFVKEGWVDSSKVLPLRYDMVELKENEESPKVRGWWTGQSWDGYRVKNQTYAIWKKHCREK